MEGPPEVDPIVSIAYFTTLGVVVAFIIPTTWMFYRMRGSPFIRFRSPVLTLLATLVGMILCAMLCIRSAIYFKFPCWVNLWVRFLTGPIYLTILFARTWRLVGFYRLNEATSVEVSRQITEEVFGTDATAFKRQSVAVDSPTTQATGTRISYYLNDANTINASRRNMPFITRLFLRHRYLMSLRFSLYVLAAHLVITLVILCALQTVVEKNAFGQVPTTISRQNCVDKSADIILVVTQSVQVFVLTPISIWLLHNVKDTLAIRRELLALLTTWVLSYIFYSAGVLLPYAPNFPVYNVLIITFVVSHVISVCLPTRMAYVERRHQQVLKAQLNRLTRQTSFERSNNMRSDFRRLLRDEDAFESFKQFAAKDLCVENPLFYDACRRILDLVGVTPTDDYRHPQSSASSTVSLPRVREQPLITDTELEQKLLWLRDTFLLDSAEQQVNLPSEITSKLVRMINGGLAAFDVQILKHAQEEIEDLMFYDTYQRYLNSGAYLNVHTNNRKQRFTWTSWMRQPKVDLTRPQQRTADSTTTTTSTYHTHRRAHSTVSTINADHAYRFA
jgi:hypothetical protein